MCNRYGNPLGSTWQQQTKTVAPNIQKQQQNEGTNMSVYIMSVCTSVLVLDEASAFFLTWSHMTRSFRKVVLTKLFLAGELQLS